MERQQLQLEGFIVPTKKGMVMRFLPFIRIKQLGEVYMIQIMVL